MRYTRLPRSGFRAYAASVPELAPYAGSLPTSPTLEDHRAALVAAEAPLSAIRALERTWREYHADCAAARRAAARDS